MARIFSETDIRIGLVILAAAMVCVIIGAIIWGSYPPHVAH